MCSVDDLDIELAGVCRIAPRSPPPCQKCRTAPAAVHLRANDIHCARCFAGAFCHKVCAVIGRARRVTYTAPLLVAFDASAASVALVHIVAQQFARRRQQRQQQRRQRQCSADVAGGAGGGGDGVAGGAGGGGDGGATGRAERPLLWLLCTSAAAERLATSWLLTEQLGSELQLFCVNSVFSAAEAASAHSSQSVPAHSVSDHCDGQSVCHRDDNCDSDSHGQLALLSQSRDWLDCAVYSWLGDSVAQQLLTLRQQSSSSSSSSSYLDHLQQLLRLHVLALCAGQLQCDQLLLPYSTSSQLAAVALAAVAEGRGHQLRQLLDFSDRCRYRRLGVELLRPLREVSAKEVSLWLYHTGRLTSSAPVTAATSAPAAAGVVYYPQPAYQQQQPGDGVLAMAGQFCGRLQSVFAGTESTVVRTVDKLLIASRQSSPLAAARQQPDSGGGVSGGGGGGGDGISNSVSGGGDGSVTGSGGGSSVSGSGGGGGDSSSSVSGGGGGSAVRVTDSASATNNATDASVQCQLCLLTCQLSPNTLHQSPQQQQQHPDHDLQQQQQRPPLSAQSALAVSQWISKHSTDQLQLPHSASLPAVSAGESGSDSHAAPLCYGCCRLSDQLGADLVHNIVATVHTTLAHYTHLSV